MLDLNVWVVLKNHRSSHLSLQAIVINGSNGQIGYCIDLLCYVENITA